MNLNTRQKYIQPKKVHRGPSDGNMDLRDIMLRYRLGEISEAEAVDLIQQIRDSQHGFFEKRLARLG